MTIDRNEMFNKHDIARDACQLFGVQAHKGYDWWWGCEYGEYSL